ncbi:hypothetical protein WH52_00065 [Tenacibaculum holothuriorum]|uniref:RNA polymerase subunit sigma-24 n=1 Tax=Tenacibaculum holothuriorum TaxID=1635173 RepID=A0A1Y2PF26_9FLAO|nr:RNA polymerase sigma factor [Tenacibaculum holothuriorum]OSY89093.1 hypothetical protein WH52_00065 [Tenacibaculum holothuriorum]
MEEEKLTDSELIESYKRGNKKVITILVKRWHIIFCKVAFIIVKDKFIAKDIAQESWKVILNKIESLQNSNKFKSWALQIVKSKSIDYLRKVNRRNKNLEKYKKELSVYNSDFEEEEETNSNIVLKKRLKKAIQSLPNKQRVVIELFYLNEYSLKEISSLLHISVGTAKSRLFNAREELKSILKHK